MLPEDFITAKGKTPAEYLASIQEKYTERWDKKIAQCELSEEQISFLKADYLPVKMVVISADWCPDCQNAVPILMKFAELSPYLELILIDRDSNHDYLNQEALLTNGGLRIPYAIFVNEKFQKISIWSERSVLTYQLLHEAKIEALSQGTDDYGQFVREKFGNNRQKLFQANIEELFTTLRKAVIIRTSAAKLDELQKPIESTPL